MPPTNSPWKSTYMRQRITEVNWKSRTVTPEKILKGHDDHVITCLQFYGNKVLSGSDDTTLKVWNALNGRVRTFFFRLIRSLISDIDIDYSN